MSQQTAISSKSNKRIITGVLGLPYRHDQRFLLTKRHAPGKKDWHNKWQIAGGGLTYGETTEECLRREMWEELRVRPTILYPHPIVTTRIWYADEAETQMDAHILLLTYIIDIGSQVPDLTHDPDWETSDYGWYTLEEAGVLDCLPATVGVVESAFAIIQKNGILTADKKALEG